MYLVFPTFEIAPVTNGGIAHYISRIIHSLHESEFIPLIILYNIPQNKADEAEQHYRAAGLNCEILHINEVSSLQPTPRDDWGIESTSLALKNALEFLVSHRKVVGIEWCEFAGLAFHTLRDKHRNRDSAFKQIPMWVHLHGAREIWDLTERYSVSLDTGDAYLYYNYAERFSLELADAWKSPSQAVADWYTSYFGIHNRVFISPLPYRKLAEKNSHTQQIRPQIPLKILCPGKIQYIKGNDIVARAGVELSKTHPNQFNITFAGFDTATANTAYTSSVQEVKSFISPKFASHFSFPGKFSAEKFLQIAKESHVAVFASRIETFCLTVHEVNWLGVPLILPDIPAFKDYFMHGINCYKFDGSSEGLVQVLTQILDNPEVLNRIKSQPIEEFTIDIFRQLIAMQPVLKVNTNYTLVASLQEKYLQQQQVAQEDLQRLERKSSSLQARIDAMETSKFWQLRRLWFKLKRALGLTKEEA